MTNAAKALAGRLQVRLQHAAHRCAGGQIDVTNDAGTGSDRAIRAARAHRRHAVHEFGFADRLEAFRPVGTVHRAALDENRRANVVSGIEVRQQFGQQIAHRAAHDGRKAMLRRGPPGQQRRRPIP